MPVKTAQTLTLADIPDGLDPAEFLNDADLAAFYERAAAALPADDPKKADLVKAAKSAGRGAAQVAFNVSEQTALDGVASVEAAPVAEKSSAKGKE